MIVFPSDKKHCEDGDWRRMEDGRTRLTRKGMAVLALLMAMVIPFSPAATVNTCGIQEASYLNDTTREASPPTTTYWANAYGGGGYDDAYCVQQTADGGYIVAGTTGSFGAGSRDVWVLKLDSAGGVTWQKAYGGGNFDNAHCIRQTSDGGYIVAGYTYSFGAGDDDAWILKLDSDGSVLWQKTYGGIMHDSAYCVQQTSDGGYVVAGYAQSFGFIHTNDAWVLRLNTNGNVLWEKTYGGAQGDYAYYILQTADGGYILVGNTGSFGAQIDVWVLKLNSTGGVTWQETYGESSPAWANSVQQTSDGGYIVAGQLEQIGAPGYDAWVLKLDSEGLASWKKVYGSSSSDGAESAQQTSDGGYVVAGFTYSFGAGSSDVWVLKFNSTGSVLWQKTYGGSECDLARSVQQTLEGGYIVAGFTESFGAGNEDVWVVKLGIEGDIVWDEGVGASTHTTSAIPSTSNTTASMTSATPADSGATVRNSQVTPVNTHATRAAQSGGIGAGARLLVIVVAALAVIVIFAAVAAAGRKEELRRDYMRARML